MRWLVQRSTLIMTFNGTPRSLGSVGAVDEDGNQWPRGEIADTYESATRYQDLVITSRYSCWVCRRRRRDRNVGKLLRH